MHGESCRPPTTWPSNAFGRVTTKPHAGIWPFCLPLMAAYPRWVVAPSIVGRAADLAVRIGLPREALQLLAAEDRLREEIGAERPDRSRLGCSLAYRRLEASFDVLQAADRAGATGERPHQPGLDQLDQQGRLKALDAVRQGRAA